MAFLGTQILGIVFLLVGTAATFLMFYQWGFPFDKEQHKSQSPPWLNRLLRVLGYAYLAIYLYMMWEMVPRLWTYQIELPARTVAHLVLGLAIGALLLVKIAVVRFFKYLENPLAPFLGTGLFLCTVLLVGLALPSYFREAYLHRGAVDPERLERLHALLELAGLKDEGQRRGLVTPQALQSGRQILLEKCVQCHDLRAVLVKPRTPANWRQTVERMADRSTFLAPISSQEQWQVTAYLIAISPTLQKTAQQERRQEQLIDEARLAVDVARPGEVAYDPQSARELFQTLCSQCHDLSDVDATPPTSEEEVQQLVARMVENGLEGTEEELAQIMGYLMESYVRF